MNGAVAWTCMLRVCVPLSASPGPRFGLCRFRPWPLCRRAAWPERRHARPSAPPSAAAPRAPRRRPGQLPQHRGRRWRWAWRQRQGQAWQRRQGLRTRHRSRRCAPRSRPGVCPLRALPTFSLLAIDDLRLGAGRLSYLHLVSSCGRVSPYLSIRSVPEAMAAAGAAPPPSLASQTDGGDPVPVRHTKTDVGLHRSSSSSLYLSLCLCFVRSQ
jgi:hypothetical protein